MLMGIMSSFTLAPFPYVNQILLDEVEPFY